MTVGELRKSLEGLDDSLPVIVQHDIDLNLPKSTEPRLNSIFSELRKVDTKAEVYDELWCDSVNDQMICVVLDGSEESEAYF